MCSHVHSLCVDGMLSFLLVDVRPVIGSRALSDPYCHLAWMSVCLCVCVFVRNFEVKYLGNEKS